jgi:hypothetical protein
MKSFLIECIADNEFSMSIPCSYSSSNVTRQGIELTNLTIGNDPKNEHWLSFTVYAKTKQIGVVTAKNKSEAVYSFSEENTGFKNSDLDSPYTVSIHGIKGKSGIMTEKSKFATSTIEAITASADSFIKDQTMLSLSAIAKGHHYRPRITKTDEMDDQIAERVKKKLAPSKTINTYETNINAELPMFYSGASRSKDGKINLHDIEPHSETHKKLLAVCEFKCIYKTEDEGEVKLLSVEPNISFLRSDKGGSAPESMSTRTMDTIIELCLLSSPAAAEMTPKSSILTSSVCVRSDGNDLIFSKQAPIKKMKTPELTC